MQSPAFGVTFAEWDSEKPLQLCKELVLHQAIADGFPNWG